MLTGSEMGQDWTFRYLGTRPSGHMAHKAHHHSSVDIGVTSTFGRVIVFVFLPYKKFHWTLASLFPTCGITILRCGCLHSNIHKNLHLDISRSYALYTTWSLTEVDVLGLIGYNEWLYKTDGEDPIGHILPSQACINLYFSTIEVHKYFTFTGFL